MMMKGKQNKQQFNNVSISQLSLIFDTFRISLFGPLLLDIRIIAENKIHFDICINCEHP